MTIVTKIETTAARLAPGIYFGLPNTDYYADPALGSGDHRNLAVCPMYYWRDSWMNPLREQSEETPALLFGRALHKLVLEGREAFEAEYTMTPEVGDHPGCLVTADDIKRALKVLGEKVTGNKPDLIARLVAARIVIAEAEAKGGTVPSAEEVIWARSAPIFDQIMEAHAGRCADGGMATLKRSVYEQVVAAAGFLASNPKVAPALSSGRPEVSVFWEVDGVPCKLRCDNLRLGKRDGKWIMLPADLKSFANQRDLPPERAVQNAIAEYRLDIQAAHYADGLAQVPALIKAGHVYGADGINPKWLEALGSVEPGAMIWHWVFYQKDAPVSLLRSASPALIEAGMRSVTSARQAYREHMAAFGTAWRYTDPMPDTAIDLADMPAWLVNAA